MLRPIPRPDPVMIAHLPCNNLKSATLFLQTKLLGYADPAIDGDHHTIHIRASPRCKVNRNARHIRRRTNSPKRTLGFDLRLKILEQPFGHLTLKRPGRYRVDCDALPPELNREHASQMMHGRFARRISVVLNTRNFD